MGCAWFSFPPVLVLILAGERPPAWSQWPAYLAALAAQFVDRKGRLDAALEADRHAALARTDALTGLLNRRGWDEVLAQYLEAAAAQPVSVCILDLDDFKSYNDAYGHPAGRGPARRDRRHLALAARTGSASGPPGG